MNNHKIMSGLLGLALTMVTAQATAPSLNYEISGNELIINYTGTLLQSADAVNWSEVASASSPYKIALGNKKQFFCAKASDEPVDPPVPGQDATVSLPGGVALNLIWIAPGTFMMGSSDDELGNGGDEILHEVTLTKGYWLGKYEVTQAQYEAVMGENPSRFKGDDLPVEMVSWKDAMAFCAKLTEIEKAAGRLPEWYEYTLPTEAQWEYACRAGTTTAFSNGTNIETIDQIYGECPNLDGIGWYYYNSASKTHPVGQKLPNAWDLYDMHGNVFEWCLDQKNKYPETPVIDPVETGTDDNYRAIRGGSYSYYDDGAKNCRSAARKTGSITMTSNSLGFRVALVSTLPVDGENITIPLVDDVKLNLIWIKPGTFIMGSPEYELGRGSDETQHQVTLTKGYWLGKYEVTQSQYEALMGENPSKYKGADQPVDSVTWYEAMAFCAKLNALEKAAGRLPEGYEYTLPTEAQWEYACRAGTTTALNSGKNLSDRLKCPEVDEVGWYNDNSGGYGGYDSSGNIIGNGKTFPVGQKQPNAWGLYDMYGNVGEWCLDWYEEYPTSVMTDPKGADEGTRRVRRGGGWSNYAFYCRSADRYYDWPNYSWLTSGFRVALAPVPVSKDVTIPLSDDVELDMIWIEPGTFTMGCSPDVEGVDEHEYYWWGEDQHKVTLTQGYWLGKYEVTQSQYQAIMGNNPSDKPDENGIYRGVGGNHPVYNVSWDDAMEFCAKLTEIEKDAGRLLAGYEYTLPTEAQWEYACRSGTMTALNSGKNLSYIGECPEMNEVGWYTYNSGKYDSHGNLTNNGKTFPVGQKRPNLRGLYDMHGNVYEWCLDWKGDYPTSSVTDPTGPSTGTRRVIRGGSWSEHVIYCRSASRDSISPSVSDYFYGFRVALAPVK